MMRSPANNMKDSRESSLAHGGRCERRVRRKRTKKVATQDCAADWSKANKEARRCSQELKLAYPLQYLDVLDKGPLSTDALNRLRQLLSQEATYHPRTDFLFRVDSANEDKVDWRLRDESTFNLRFLHKFLNLSPLCFAYSVNIADRFLAKVKVKPKYMACLATASYLIAVKLVEPTADWPSPDKLVNIARCGGSASDLQRMESIIRSKLLDSAGEFPPLEQAVTPLHFLLELRPFFPTTKSFQRAVGELEMCMCSAGVYKCRASLLAASLARRHLEADQLSSALLLQLANACNLTQSELSVADGLIDSELRRVQSRTPSPRTLEWNLSRRTFASLQRPSAAAQSSQLGTISEDWREDENWQLCRLFD